MRKKRNQTPDKRQDRDLEKDIERANRNPISQESLQQNQSGHFGGQHEKGPPFDPDRRR